MHWFLPFAILFIGVMFAETAFAFSYSTCLGERLKWDSNTVTLRASPVSFPVGPWRTALTTAVARFNLNPSQFRYNLVTDTGGVRRDNGQNEIWGTSDPGLLKGSPARAHWQYTCFWFFGDHVHMDEVDIVFDYRSPWQWSSSENKTTLLNYGGTLRPLQTTAIHEISHGLQLNHVNTEYNVLGQDFTHIHVNGATAQAYLGEDASDGAVFLYGTSSPAREDVGVVHWKYSGASGEYSTHTKTQLFDSMGNVLPNFLDGGEIRYRVAPGQTVQAEFTYENNGANRQNNVAVGFYISTNDTITTADQRIGGITLNLGRDNVFTTRATLTIPATLQFDRDFWLGAVVDEAGAIDEILESNNATYIPIRTTLNPVPIPGNADLSVFQIDSPDPVVEGEALTYSVIVTNNGPDAAQSVILIDNLPAIASFRSATASQGTCAGGISEPSVTCQLGSLPPGTGAGVTIVVGARVGTGTLTNIVSVSSDVNDPNLGNNTETENTTVLIP